MQDKMSTRTLLFVIVAVIFQIEASNASSNISDLNTTVADSLNDLQSFVNWIEVHLNESQPDDIAQLERRLRVVKNYYDAQISQGNCSAEKTERCSNITNKIVETFKKKYIIEVNECYDSGARLYKNFTDHFMSQHLQKQNAFKILIKEMDADCSTDKNVHECIESWDLNTQLANWKAEILAERQNNIVWANQQLGSINLCVRSSLRKMNEGFEYYQPLVMTCVKCYDIVEVENEENSL
ncbi:uncharacterized protein LOC135164384 [Diachasmimorpha longicaudata]|uniref:uncharacterized protein LOC135164384 n=1 Tax=Diachasmimorpha longicaudata TaxID=58733 RepID=UPI0030B8D0E4